MNQHNRTRYLTAMTDWERRKYPQLPYLTPDKTNDKDANTLTKCVKNWLLAHGHFAERVNTMGVYREAKAVNTQLGVVTVQQKGKWTKSQSTAGSADIHAQIKPNGVKYAIPVKIEVKWGKDRQSEAQRAYQANVEQAGGVYVIITSFDQFIEWYDKFMMQC